MTPEKCWGYKVFPLNEFYAVHYSAWEAFFNPNYTNEVLALSQNSTGIHVWNKLSFGDKLNKSGPKTAYGAIAEKNCPKVYGASGDYF